MFESNASFINFANWG